MSHANSFATNIPGREDSETVSSGENGQSATRSTQSSSANGRDGTVNVSTTESGGRPTQSLASNVVSALEGYVDAFRKKEATKAKTIALISGKLDFRDGGNFDEPEKEAALAEYLSAIESIERLDASASRRGTLLGVAQSETRQPQRGFVEPQEPATGGQPGRNVESFFENLTSSKRGRENTPENESVGEDGDRGFTGCADGSLSNKKQRVCERDMPWFKKEQRARELANPSCTQTREALATVGNDLATSKRWILQSTAAPQGFPNSEWDNILKGNSVDLDKVFSSLHLIAPVKQSIGRVGDTTISLGDTEPRRRVQSSGDWMSAWHEATKATAFVFEHREQELRDYGDYIMREFSSKATAAHRKIILYDAAVRNMVGGGQSVLLTDYHKFNHIYSAIVLTDGAQSDLALGKTPSPSRPRNGDRDICRRFNSTSFCPDGSTCRYKHVCYKCKRGGHNLHSCESSTGKTGSRTAS